MKRLPRITTVIFLILSIGFTVHSNLWAKDIRLHDINGSVVDTGKMTAIDPPRRASDGRFWVLTVYLKSPAGPMALKFQYPPEKENLARQDYNSIIRER